MTGTLTIQFNINAKKINYLTIGTKTIPSNCYLKMRGLAASA